MAEENNYMESDRFLNRLSRLPLINAALQTTTNFYKKAKDSNKLVKLTLNAAEKTVNVVAGYATPVISKLEMPMALANRYACNALIIMETKVPMIKKTPEEIYVKTRAMMEITVLQAVVGMFNAGKMYSIQKANTVKNYGISKVNPYLNTKYGRYLLFHLYTASVKADRYMDKLFRMFPSKSQPRDLPFDGQFEEHNVVNDGNRIKKVVVLSRNVVQRFIIFLLIKLQDTMKSMHATLTDLLMKLDSLVLRAVMEIADKCYRRAHAEVLRTSEEFGREYPGLPCEVLLNLKLLAKSIVDEVIYQFYTTFMLAAVTLAYRLPDHFQEAILMRLGYCGVVTEGTSHYYPASFICRLRDAIKICGILSSIFSQAMDMRVAHEVVCWIDNCVGVFLGTDGAPVDGAEGDPFDGGDGAPFDGADGIPFDGADNAPFDGSDGDSFDGSDSDPFDDADGAPIVGADGAPIAVANGVPVVGAYMVLFRELFLLG